MKFNVNITMDWLVGFTTAQKSCNEELLIPYFMKRKYQTFTVLKVHYLPFWKVNTFSFPPCSFSRDKMETHFVFVVSYKYTMYFIKSIPHSLSYSPSHKSLSLIRVVSMHMDVGLSTRGWASYFCGFGVVQRFTSLTQVLVL